MKVTGYAFPERGEDHVSNSKCHFDVLPRLLWSIHPPAIGYGLIGGKKNHFAGITRNAQHQHL